MPGLKASPEPVPPVLVFAPEQARLRLATPSAMCACADFERWQPLIASPLGVSQYAVEPSASTREEDWFVLPAQRPASPEIAESPSVTTVGVPVPGPSAHAAGASASTSPTATISTRTSDLIRTPPRWLAPSSPRGARPVNQAGSKTSAVT